jgi:hypothetical protein
VRTAIKKLRRQYDKLDDLERFRLTLAADVRGDDEELKALGESARRATYRQIAYPFAGMWSAAMLAGMMTAIDVLKWGCLLAWDQALILGDGPLAEEREREAWGMMQEMAGYIIAAWEGLAVFADDLGLDLEHVRRFVPSRPKVDFVLRIAEGVLEIEEKTMRIVIGRMGEESEEILEEREGRLAQRRQEAAREHADGLLEIWKLETDQG